MTKHEPKTQLPDDIAAFAKLFILVAWQAGELSEGRVVEALQMSRVEVRALRDNSIANGVKCAELLRRSRR